MKIDTAELKKIIELTDLANSVDLEIVIGQANLAGKKAEIKEAIKLFGKAGKTYCAAKDKKPFSSGALRLSDKAFKLYDKATGLVGATAMMSLAERFIILSKKNDDNDRKRRYINDGLVWYERAFAAGGEFSAQLCEQIGDEYNLNNYILYCEIKWYERAVDAGNEQASMKVAHSYLVLSQVSHESKWKTQAYKWYEKAANYGIVEAAVKFAKYCEQQAKDGENRAKTQMAIEWYEKAAEWGSEEAAQRLKAFAQGVDQSEPERLYQKGMAACKSGRYKKAAELFSGSAELGYTDAVLQLAILYRDGKGVEADREKAAGLFNQLAEAGNAEAMYYLAQLGNGKEAIELYKKAAEAGCEAAETYLKDYYRKKKSKSGLDWLKEYAERHHDPKIMLYIAENSEGDDVYEWYRKAAKTGDSSARYKFGEYCYHKAMGYYNGDGKGHNQNYEKAVELFKTAADFAITNAMYMLGMCYKNGHGVAVDKYKMADWFFKAAKAIHPEAMYELGVCYGYGEGLMKDRDMMMHWFKQAADRGSKNAKNALNNLRIAQAVDEGYAELVRRDAEEKRKAAEAQRIKEAEAQRIKEAAAQREKVAAEAQRRIAEAQRGGSVPAQQATPAQQPVSAPAKPVITKKIITPGGIDVTEKAANLQPGRYIVNEDGSGTHVIPTLYHTHPKYLCLFLEDDIPTMTGDISDKFSVTDSGARDYLTERLERMGSIYNKISLLTDGCEVIIDRIGESKNGSMDIRSYDYESYMRLKVSVIGRREDFFGLIGAKDPVLLRARMENELKYEYGKDYKKSIEGEVMDFDDYLLDSRHYREDMQYISNNYDSYIKRNGDKVQKYLDNIIHNIWREKPFYVLATGETYKFRNGASSNGEKVNCQLIGLKTIFKWYYES